MEPNIKARLGRLLSNATVIPKKKRAAESVTAEFARPINGATRMSEAVAMLRVAALPCLPANFPTGPSATSTPRDIMSNETPRTELESSSLLFKSGIRETKFPALNPRERNARVTPR